MDQNTILCTATSGECEAIDLIHFTNTIADAAVACPSLLSLDQMHTNGARLMTPGFSITHSNLKNAKWSESTCTPALKERRNKIKERNPFISL